MRIKFDYDIMGILEDAVPCDSQDKNWIPNIRSYLIYHQKNFDDLKNQKSKSLNSNF